jgi:hypothetical protein
MSAWGINNFDNDTAIYWLQRLIDEDEDGIIKNTIEGFSKNFRADRTDIIECSEFLAAAEVVAALTGNPAEQLPVELEDWIQGQYIQIDQKALEECHKGVELILKDSELKEMFLDSGYFKSWEKEQRNLIKRLKS